MNNRKSSHKKATVPLLLGLSQEDQEEEEEDVEEEKFRKTCKCIYINVCLCTSSGGKKQA